MAGDPLEGAWTAHVQAEEEFPLAREIGHRFGASRPALSVSVSDLLAPRRAYYRRFAPETPVAADRQERMEAGRAWHDRLIRALPDEGAFEVRLRRDGIVGRIDLWADVPVEVKTGTPVPPEALLAHRPDHVEQIAMYCALSGRDVGRIVTFAPGGDRLEVGATDLRFRDRSGMASTLRTRAEALRAAIRDQTPERLPACRWFGRRCEFQEAGLCRCTGREPPAGDDLLGQVAAAEGRPDVAARWGAALAAERAPLPAPAAGRFRELLYLRRTYFERSRAATGPLEPPAASVPVAPDLFARLLEAVEGGPVGEVARLPPTAPLAGEEVPGFRGTPFLVKSSRAWNRVRPRDAVERLPQYALELGFRCAATGTSEGRVFLAYERAESDLDRFQVLRYRFRAPEVWAALGEARVARLRTALERQDPAALPPCPAWMYDGCPYRPACGCGPERSQR